jgi:hypothetical protein
LYSIQHITRVRYDGGVHAAKAGEFFAGSMLAFNGKEVVIDVSYRLMVWSARNVLTLSAELRSIVPQLNEPGPPDTLCEISVVFVS